MYNKKFKSQLDTISNIAFQLQKESERLESTNFTAGVETILHAIWSTADGLIAMIEGIEETPKWEPTDEEIDKSVKEMYNGAFGE